MPPRRQRHGETTVPAGATGNLVGCGYGDITPGGRRHRHAGHRPGRRSILYVVSKSVDASQTVFYQRLHAIDLASGRREAAGSPVNIAATYPTGSGGTRDFDPRQENQRAGLALVGGTVYIAWASHEDSPPWYGWVIGYTYNGSAFTQTAVLNVRAQHRRGGHLDERRRARRWTPPATCTSSPATAPSMPPARARRTTTTATRSCSSSRRRGSAHSVSSYFTPTDQADDNAHDLDFGAGGAALVLNLAQRLAAAPGGRRRQGRRALRPERGQHGRLGRRQRLPDDPRSERARIFATARLLEQHAVPAPIGRADDGLHLRSERDASSAPRRPRSRRDSFGFPGATASVSASGASSNGIVWAINSHDYCTPQSGGLRPGGAARLLPPATSRTELWNSAHVGGRRGRQRGEVHRAHGRQRQGVRRHARQQQRRGHRLDHRARRAGRLRPEAQLTAVSEPAACGAGGAAAGAESFLHRDSRRRSRRRARRAAGARAGSRGS